MFPSADDIPKLIRGCLKNDRRAQEELYKRFYPALMALCVRYCRDSRDATEVLNDAFLKVFRQLSGYNAAKATLYTWMRMIVINTALDALRKQKTHRDLERLPPEIDEPGIDNEALSKLSGDQLLGLIHQLPDTARMVFNLYILDGYSHKEVAALLQISEGTSRWYLNEGRRQLKTILNQMEARQ